MNTRWHEEDVAGRVLERIQTVLVRLEQSLKDLVPH
jgi:hypothetical protein